jgi:hypothetical protein
VEDPNSEVAREARDRGLLQRARRAHLSAQRLTMLAEVTPMNLAEADRILRLSDSQLAIVRQAAAVAICPRSLPQNRRGRASGDRARR